ncbi:hypothetical protein D3C72_782480 [compost metagenome]
MCLCTNLLFRPENVLRVHHYQKQLLLQRFSYGRNIPSTIQLMAKVVPPFLFCHKLAQNELHHTRSLPDLPYLRLHSSNHLLRLLWNLELAYTMDSYNRRTIGTNLWPIGWPGNHLTYQRMDLHILPGHWPI